MMNSYHTTSLFGTRAKVSVLRVLVNVAVPLSIREIAAQAGISHVAASAALQELTPLGVVAVKAAGRARVHWLERRSLLTCTIVLPVFEAERDYEQRALCRLAEVAGDLYSVVLFGSRARGEAVGSSDYDLLAVDPDPAVVAQAELRFQRLSTELHAALGVDVSLLAYTLEEARALMDSGDNFMQGVLRDGVVVVGVHPREWASI